jgi:hypothetical protein
MAKHPTKKSQHELEGKETVEFFQDLDREALNTEKLLEKYAKPVGGIFLLLVLGVLGYFAYQQYIVAPKNDEAIKGFLQAQKQLSEGKDAEALGGKSKAKPGFVGTYNEYSDTTVGKLSAYNAGLIELKQGNFQKGYDLLDKFSSDNKIFVAMKYGAMADCQSGLNKNEDAIALLDKAIASSNDPYTSYYFTKKAGILALGMNKKAEAKKYFSTIDEKYKDQDNGMSDAYIEMVKYF